ncbi:MAG: FAD-dependent oxidoreductase [Erysipelotrichaceae bacterium]|nr:FAD-dependent oxidoreductase [Erysipelotrichaceae bacterium]
MKSLKLSNTLTWVGALDPDLRVFDIIMETKFGTTYNSYVLKGTSKTALIETAKLKTFDQYIEKVKEVVDPKDVDYIIVNHTEPDHSGSVVKLLEFNPKIQIIGTALAIEYLKEIVNGEFDYRIVNEGETLDLGDLTLEFIMAPNLHWPDTMYTYVRESGVLFTCDSFGAHYSFDQVLLSKVSALDDYHEALKYYYDMILGPFPSFMLKALDRIQDLPLTMIAPGHGPVLDVRIPEIMATYRDWATIVNPNTRKTVIMPYVSSYGYTEKLAKAIKEGIQEAGDIEVRSFDLVTTPIAKVAGEIFYADGVLLGTPTILGDALKPLWDLTSVLYPVIHGGKIASVFGSYGWSGEGVPNLVARLGMLRMDVVDGLSIRFNPDEKKLAIAKAWGKEFGKKLLERDQIKGRLRAWKCILCGEIIISENRPNICPVCGAPADQFIEIPYNETTFHQDSNETFVLIGAGAAAINAAEAIRIRNTTAKIVILSEEQRLTYNRPQLTKDFMGDYDSAGFLLKEREWYVENSIDLRLGVKATKIDPTQKTVELSDGSSVSYSKLILTTGASCFIPPIKGSVNENVVVIRNTKDVDKIKELIPMIKKVVVIGGGILGLEAAWQFKKLGLEIVVLELAPMLMTRQLDDVSSSRLRKLVEAQNIAVHTAVQITEISAENNWAKGVLLADGRFIEGDLIVVSAGVKANVDLAKEIGVTVNRAIVVNEKMETNIPDVYAAGDCVEFGGINYAIWPQALEQGKVAGANAVGDNTAYYGVIPIVSMHCLETELFALGDPGKDPNKKYNVIDFVDDIKHATARYFFTQDGLVGGVLLHDMSNSINLIDGINNHLSPEKFLAKVI